MKAITAVYDEGSTIYSPFSTDQEVFIITLGYVIAYTLEDTGKRRIHLIYGPGSYFPVITTFRKASQRATYEALTRVAVNKYPLKDFVAQIDTDPDFTKEILQKTVKQLGIFADIVVNLHTTKLQIRLLNRLQALAKNHGTPGPDGTTLPFKLKHHYLADMLGTERESVSRALQALKRKNAIKLDTQGHIVVMA